MNIDNLVKPEIQWMHNFKIDVKRYSNIHSLILDFVYAHRAAFSKQIFKKGSEITLYYINTKIQGMQKFLSDCTCTTS